MPVTWLTTDKIQDNARYTIKEVMSFLGNTEPTVRLKVEKMPDQYRINQNKIWKFKKYLVSGRGIKFLLWII